MRSILKMIGEVLEFVRGPGVTSVVEGETINRTFSLTFESTKLQYVVSCKRVIHRTIFNRWWIPPIKRATFEVEGKAVNGGVSEKLSMQITFPDLSSFGLRETHYPHIRAISAYLDRVALANGMLRD